MSIRGRWLDLGSDGKSDFSLREKEVYWLRTQGQNLDHSPPTLVTRISYRTPLTQFSTLQNGDNINALAMFMGSNQ